MDEQVLQFYSIIHHDDEHNLLVIDVIVEVYGELAPIYEDYGIDVVKTAIENEVEALEKENEEFISLLAAYADCLEQMDCSHAVMNNTSTTSRSSSRLFLIMPKRGKR